tara:strand:- start:648 stop:851 length:204 start_codon:yes stop_codon:yes gene_type:complete
MTIQEEIKKIRLDKDLKDIQKVFSKLNDLCWDEAGMNFNDFMKYREETSRLKDEQRGFISPKYKRGL